MQETACCAGEFEIRTAVKDSVSFCPLCSVGSSYKLSFKTLSSYEDAKRHHGMHPLGRKYKIRKYSKSHLRQNISMVLNSSSDVNTDDG